MRFFIVIFAVLFSHFAVVTPAVSQEKVAVEEVIIISEAMRERILDEAHVRGFVWGLSPAVVKEGEKGTFVEEGENGTLFFVDEIDGVRYSITYEFDDDKLYRAQIFSEKKYTRPQARVEDMVEMKRYLDSRFGDPVSEDFEWKSDRDKKFPNQWGWSIYNGSLIINIKWQDQETAATAYLGSPKPYKPVLFWVYEDVKRKQVKMEENKLNSIKILP